MLPSVGRPETIRQGMAPYRALLGREAGFDPVRRYVTGLLLSPPKTLPGSYALPVGATEPAPSRRAMPAAVCQAAWDAESLLACQRAVLAPASRGRGRAGLSLAWPSGHPERSSQRGGVKPAWAPVEQRMGPYQPVVPAVSATRERLAGVAVVVQAPARRAEAEASWQEAVRQSDEQRAAARGRWLEWLSQLQPRLEYKPRTELGLELGHQLAHEGHCPQAP